MSKTSEVLSYYRMREKTTNYLQTPKKGVDNGIGGKTYEVEVVARIVGRVTGVKKAGHCDLIWHGRHHEIKIGSGQLGTLTYKADGTPVEHIKKNDFFVYCPEYINTVDPLLQAYVIPYDIFLQGLKELGLYRYKISSYAYHTGCKKADRISIQSFKNSNKKYNEFYDFLEANGILAINYFND